MEREWKEMLPNCPRCGSINTKFCYYNNYSLSQPRYFCKGCRRYWTKGGSLRNVPVGGGCRKSRRSRPWSSLRLASSNNHHHHHHSATISHGDNNTQLGHNPRKLSVEEESITTEAQPTIDLGVVYANFLNQKPERTVDSSMSIELPELEVVPSVGYESPLFDKFSSTPLLDDSHVGNDHSSTSVPRPHHTNSMLDCTNNFSESLSVPSSSNEHISMGLSPLSWAPSPSDGNHHGNCNLAAPGLLDLEPELEADAQFSNYFMGSWSTLDLQGFDTSASKLDCSNKEA